MFLPHELIIQILLRLPVKSLIRFKSVCKLWFSLISHDSHFANSHFQLTATKSNPKILLISTSTHESRSIDLEASLRDDTASVSLNLDYMFQENFTNFKIKGSCRGFILFCGSFNIYLWNPSTGLHKQIPFSSKLGCYYSFGFGYDDSTEDYLVVSMSHNDNDSYDLPLHLEYFSLKSNTWKEVEGPHFPYTNRYMCTVQDEPKGGSLYKGAIHWLAYRYDLRSDVIVAFDLKKRKLSYMHLPRGFDDGIPFQRGLWIYGELLSAYTYNRTNDTVEIWLMKEYKVNSSWTMTLVLPLDRIPSEYFCRPLCCTKSGDIIGTDGSGLVKYDKNGQFLEQHSYSNYDHRCQVAMYIDSLLSLPSDGDNQQA